MSYLTPQFVPHRKLSVSVTNSSVSRHVDLYVWRQLVSFRFNHKRNVSTVSVQVTITKIHENPTDGSCVVPSGQTDRARLVVALRTCLKIVREQRNNWVKTTSKQKMCMSRYKEVKVEIVKSEEKG